MCGHPGLPDGGELVSPPGPGQARYGLPGARAEFSAGDVAVFGCQASPQQTKHHAATASAVIIVINQNYPPSRGRAWPVMIVMPASSPATREKLRERQIMTTRPHLFYELQQHLSSSFPGHFKMSPVLTVHWG